MEEDKLKLDDLTIALKICPICEDAPPNAGIICTTCDGEGKVLIAVNKSKYNLMHIRLK
jgi:hypothetical protein